MFNIGGAEFLVIALVALLVLGPDKLPEAARKVGNVTLELRKMSQGFRTEFKQALDDPLEVVSDSTYVVNCFRDGWWRGWLAKGWVNAKRQPVANRDLWEPLVALVRARDVRFRWVKGHGGDPMNDKVDRLAVEAARAAR